MSVELFRLTSKFNQNLLLRQNYYIYMPNRGTSDKLTPSDTVYR